MKTDKFAFAIATLLVSSAAHSADWQYIGAAGEAVYLIDAQSVTGAPPFRKAWFKLVYPNEQTVVGLPDKKYHSEKMLWYFHCQARTYTVVQSVKYSQASEPVESISVPFVPSRMADVIPESIGEILMGYVCKAKLRN
jgi:hypothetical protein